MNKGLFEHLPKILASKHEKIFEQGAWAVGNIASDEGGFKETLLKYNVIEPLVIKIMRTNDESVLKYTSWALCSLVNGGSNNAKKKMAIAALVKLIQTQDDLEVLSQSLSALLSITDPHVIQVVIESGLVKRFVALTRCRFQTVLFPLLQMISFITNGNDQQTQAVIDNGGIEAVFDLLRDERLDLYCKRECLWIISNVSVGTFAQMKYVFSNLEWVDTLFKYCFHDNPKVKSSLIQIKREAIWSICNSTKPGDKEHIQFLVDRGVFKIYSANLESSSDSNIIKTIIESLNQILRHGVSPKSGPNDFQAQLEVEGIVDKLEGLQLHPTRSVYDVTITLIETYFDVFDPI